MSTFPGRTPTDLVRMLAPAYGTGEMSLPVFDPGGYRIAYYTQSGDALCGDCAAKDMRAMLADTEWPLEASDYPVIADVLYESDYDVRCENCNVLLCDGYRE